MYFDKMKGYGNIVPVLSKSRQHYNNTKHEHENLLSININKKKPKSKTLSLPDSW